MIENLKVYMLCMFLILTVTINISIEAGYGSRLSTTSRLATSVLRQTIVPASHAIFTHASCIESNAVFAEHASTKSNNSSRMLSTLKSASNLPAIIPPKQATISITQKVVLEQSRFINWKKLKSILQVVVGSIAVHLIINEIKEIVDAIKMTNNIEAFDPNLIPDEIALAIVRILVGIPQDSALLEMYNIEKPFDADEFVIGTGSATILKGKNSDFYYVLTAAHCVVEDCDSNLILIRNDDSEEWLQIVPLIVDREKDVAILLIHPEHVTSYQTKTGFKIPSISTDYISSRVPERLEAVSIQGYPGFLPIEERKPYCVTAATAAKTKVEAELNDSFSISSLTLFQPSQLKQHLSGASGGPIITLKNDEPHIVGVLSLEIDTSNSPFSLSIIPSKSSYQGGAGVGELSEYVAKAEALRQTKIIPALANRSVVLVDDKNSSQAVELP